jgi:ATP-dependent helicase/nuclease subunit A
MINSFKPIDHENRNRIVNNLNETLFVEAGAGTGKTTALVQRIVSLVKAGNEMKKIAAITFTEAAAGELRNRIRQELE